MVALFLATTIISCSKALALISNITRVVGLTEYQKKEIVEEIKTIIPTCPVVIKKDEFKK